MRRPLLLNVKDMLAPQAYLRVTSIGIADPMGYVISRGADRHVVARHVDLGAVAMRGKDYATVQRGGGGLARRSCGRGRRVSPTAGAAHPVAGAGAASSACCCCRSPRCGRSARCPTASPWRITAACSAKLQSTSRTRCSTASLAALIDVVIGTAIAYLVLRTRLPGARWLDWAATAALAIPGVVLGIGYLRTFYGVQAAGRHAARHPLDHDRAGLAIRRLPYALRACYAALQQISVSLEEAAEISAPPRPARCGASSCR